MTFSPGDIAHMQRALQLAALGMYTTSPNPRVGCVIVSDTGAVIGEGYHRRAGEPHAEINAMNHAGSSLRGATVYVTLEPCCHQGRTGPCSVALIAAGVSRVVFAMDDPNPQVCGEGIAQLRQAGIVVQGPLLETAARELNSGFIKRMTQGLPKVRCKMAMSLDGRTAMASGESKWITGPAAREDVQRLRAQSCAVVTGVECVLRDNPQLNVRLPEVERQPLRVVVDSKLRTPHAAAVFASPETAVVASCKALTADIASPPFTHWQLPEKNARVDLHALVKRLAQESVNEVLVESGATLAGAFLAQGLVDELIIYMAATLMGSRGRPLFDIAINTMSAQLSLSIRDIRAVGDDWRITAVPDPDA